MFRMNAARGGSIRCWRRWTTVVSWPDVRVVCNACGRCDAHSTEVRYRHSRTVAVVSRCLGANCRSLTVDISNSHRIAGVIWA